jgi:hypothetical protein
MSNRKKTTILLLAVGAALLAWDIIVATNDIWGDTISEIIRDISYRIWFLPWGFGGIMGHLFWHKKNYEDPNVTAMIGSSTALIAANVAAYYLQWPMYWWGVLLIFVMGFVAAHFWWSLKTKGGKIGT